MRNIGNRDILAKNLQHYIDRSGKDRRELAAIWGFPYSTLTEWINGRKYPRIDKIEIMANYFGILKSDLIEEKGIDNSPVEMAERHAAMLNDEDLNEIFDLLQLMDAETRKIAKGLLRSLVDTKKEA